ncbi:hypothetical protein N658DRAFT_483163 [Parathielavia hyrcaniae]|uniref:DUF7492 domain-containing protein n=1 Tax=Parathielavia hyrcaniae TaxID=113614 RepID=A0AAN6Q8W1_9PEZI|nr:hypothetical protein N658DRAFT_483163 [Parathielavia hyrcaniae]
MKTFLDRTHGLVAVWLLAALSGTAEAHSWPEEAVRLAPNGAMVGSPGYDRAHDPNDSAGFLVPPNGGSKEITPELKLVRDSQQKLTDASYPAQFPMLSVAPGDIVAIKHRENGHVSRADQANPTKPVNRGTIYLYGTTETDLTNTKLMDVHLTWTSDGTGGNGKGKLLATRNYDDGQCHEPIPRTGDIEGIVGFRQKFTNTEALLCQADLQIPKDAPVGKTLTVIWVWDWPTMNVQGVAVPPASYNATSGDTFVDTPELYTGVLDFKVVEPCDASLGDLKGPTCESQASKANAQFDVNQAATTRGIATQMAEPFLVKIPQAGFDVPSATADPKHIPFGVLVGKRPTEFPLPSSILEAQNGPTEAPSSGGGNNGEADGEDGDVMVTQTSTVPEDMATVTVTRQSSGGAAPAARTPAPKAKMVRARRPHHW